MQTSATVPDSATHERFYASQIHDPVACAESSRALMQLARRVAASECTVLIAGESGTGKEVLARYIHAHSTRSRRVFVGLNCAAIPENMLEAVLFGWERGAFTGAHNAHPGKFEQAQDGTLLLDEISEIPMTLQAKLLRVLQEKEVRPVGSNDKIPVDVRVIAATNRDLEAAYRNGTFRKDLYFRLNVVTVHLPSLREHRTDIPQLVHCFLDRYAPDENIQVTAAAMKNFLQYEWPGNVRELENCIARAVALGDHRLIDVADLPPGVAVEPAPNGIDTDAASLSTTALADLERMTILRVFEQAGGDKALAGRMLGISRATLYRKLKQYNIPLRSSTKRPVEPELVRP